MEKEAKQHCLQNAPASNSVHHERPQHHRTKIDYEDGPNKSTKLMKSNTKESIDAPAAASLPLSDFQNIHSSVIQETRHGKSSLYPPFNVYDLEGMALPSSMLLDSHRLFVHSDYADLASSSFDQTHSHLQSILFANNNKSADPAIGRDGAPRGAATSHYHSAFYNPVNDKLTRKFLLDSLQLIYIPYFRRFIQCTI